MIADTKLSVIIPSKQVINGVIRDIPHLETVIDSHCEVITVKYGGATVTESIGYFRHPMIGKVTKMKVYEITCYVSRSKKEMAKRDFESFARAIKEQLLQDSVMYTVNNTAHFVRD